MPYKCSIRFMLHMLSCCHGASLQHTLGMTSNVGRAAERKEKKIYVISETTLYISFGLQGKGL